MNSTTSPLKVWQLDPAQITPYYNIAVCDALAEAGCSVRYFTSQFLYDTELPESQHVKKEQIYFRGLERKWLLRYPRLRRVLRGLSYPIGHLQLLLKVRDERPDIVHFQWSRVPNFDLWLIRRIQALAIPVIHTVHDVVPLYAASSGTSPLKTVYETVDGLVVHTEANKSDFLRAYPNISSDRVHIIPLIEYTETELPRDASKAQARALLGIPADVPLVGFFGSIKHYKGLDILVDAFYRVIERRPDTHLLVGGKIDALDQGRVPSLESLLKVPNAHIFEGYLPTSTVWMYFLAPDILVLPYRHIYQSAALITAMGYGCPIIGTDVGGLPETVDGNGWIIPSENPVILADTIIEALSDPSRLERMSQRSREIINERHSKPVVAERLVGVYRSVLRR